MLYLRRLRHEGEDYRHPFPVSEQRHRWLPVAHEPRKLRRLGTRNIGRVRHHSVEAAAQEVEWVLVAEEALKPKTMRMQP